MQRVFFSSPGKGKMGNGSDEADGGMGHAVRMWVAGGWVANELCMRCAMRVVIFPSCSSLHNLNDQGLGWIWGGEGMWVCGTTYHEGLRDTMHSLA